MKHTRDEENQGGDTVSLAHGTIETKQVGFSSPVKSGRLQIQILGHACYSSR